ncbi:MAG: hypothetical protein GQ538_05570 [Xanthomonadales bacterium]|nr:hypothetical protein [Xanthomonadales bacterium]
MSFIKELKRRNVFRVGIAYTVATWLLIQVVDIVFPRIGLPDSAVTLVIALLAIGFIPALIFAWAFEMTPDGIKREKEVDRSQSITPKTGGKLDRIIIAVLVLVIVLMIAERFWITDEDEGSRLTSASDATVSTDTVAASTNGDDQRGKPDSQRQSVAVLPFTSMSSGEDDGYFADGLTEEVLNSLARLPELLVTARTSSFHFKDKNLPITEIAKTLGVDHVVEGSVRRSGDRVRITAQLIRADDGFHLWSNTYDRTLEDVFAVQEDIAENIASTLDVVLNEDKRQKMRAARIQDVEAFIALQKGHEAFALAHTTGDPGQLLPEANRWFDQALEIVPELTMALYLRTDLYGHLLYENASGARSHDELTLLGAQREIRLSLNKAWQSAVNDSQRAILDAERTLLSDNWTGLSEKIDQAYQSTKCIPVNWMDSLAVVFGWAAQAATFERRLIRCDPLSQIPAIFLAYWEIWNGNAAEAVRVADHYLDIQGFHPWLDDARFYALLASGQYRTSSDMPGTQPEGSSVLAPRAVYFYAINNDIDTARKTLDDWRADHTIDDMNMLIIEASLGNRQVANKYASIIDARIGGTLVLTETIRSCICGAPFDLEATPTFKKRIDEAGLNWPPLSPIDYPAKDW